MKKITRRSTHAESIRRPKLQLAKEAIRTLRAGDLAAVNGAEATCVTTSWTSDQKTLDSGGTKK